MVQLIGVCAAVMRLHVVVAIVLVSCGVCTRKKLHADATTASNSYRQLISAWLLFVHYYGSLMTFISDGCRCTKVAPLMVVSENELCTPSTVYSCNVFVVVLLINSASSAVGTEMASPTITAIRDYAMML